VKKFGYSLDETGNWRIQPEEAAVVRLVFTRYVTDQKSMDVLAYSLPMEVSPRTPGGKIWQEHHVHTILCDSNYAGVEETPTGFAPGQYPPISPIELFNTAQLRLCRLTNPNYRAKIKTICFPV
jgi:Recombinase